MNSKVNRLILAIKLGEKSKNAHTNTIFKVWSKVAENILVEIGSERSPILIENLALDLITQLNTVNNEIIEHLNRLEISETVKRVTKDSLKQSKTFYNPSSMNTSWPKVQTEMLDRLYLMDEILSEKGDIDNSEKVDNEEVIQKITNLIKEISESDLSDYLKNYIIEILSSLAFTINLQSLYGDTAVKKSYVKTIVDIQAFELENESSKDRGLIKEFFNKILQIGTFVQSIQSISESIKLLSPPD